MLFLCFSNSDGGVPWDWGHFATIGLLQMWTTTNGRSFYKSSYTNRPAWVLSPLANIMSLPVAFIYWKQGMKQRKERLNIDPPSALRRGRISSFAPLSHVSLSLFYYWGPVSSTYGRSETLVPTPSLLKMVLYGNNLLMILLLISCTHLGGKFFFFFVK